MIISLHNLHFFAFHGFYPEEQRIGCNYTIDLTITIADEQSGTTDNLLHTLNYEQVYDVVKQEMNIPSKLIEHVAQRIIDRLTNEFPIITHIHIQLFKHNPPLGGQVGKVSIQLEKTKK